MSKSSESDKRYDRYAEIFNNPINEHVIELGNRVLHWSFMENFAPYVAHGASSSTLKMRSNKRGAMTRRLPAVRPRRAWRRRNRGARWLPSALTGPWLTAVPQSRSPQPRSRQCRTGRGRT